VQIVEKTFLQLFLHLECNMFWLFHAIKVMHKIINWLDNWFVSKKKTDCEGWSTKFVKCMIKQLGTCQIFRCLTIIYLIRSSSPPRWCKTTNFNYATQIFKQYDFVNISFMENAHILHTFVVGTLLLTNFFYKSLIVSRFFYFD